MKFKLAVLFCIMSSLWATPSLAQVTEIETHCDLFDCYSVFEVDRNLQPFIDMEYRIPDFVTGIPDNARDYALGKFVTHKGEVSDVEIEILDAHTMKISGRIPGGTSNQWGFSVLGDTSHLNSTWWESALWQCANWSITEVNGTDRIMQPVIFNATGLVNKTADSGDFRIVDTYCNNLGNNIEYEILSNTSESVYFATFVNATANTTTKYSFYWYNKTTPMVSGDNPDLFLYANNGSHWESDGGTAVATVTTNSEFIFVNTDGSNKANFTIMEGDYATGRWDFAYDIELITADANGVGFGIGDDYIGGGHSAYQDWLGWCIFYGTGANIDFNCYDATGSDTLIDNTITGIWHTVKMNLTLPLSTTAGINVTINDNNAWYSIGGYPVDYNSIYSLRLFGSGGDIRVKNIFVSNHSFNTYTVPLSFAVSGIEYKPPDIVLYNITFEPPTPDDNDTIGFDVSVLFNFTVQNVSAIYHNGIELNGVIHEKPVNATLTFTGQELNLSGGNLYTYRGFVGQSTEVLNYTEYRVLKITALTQDQINETVTVTTVSALLLLLLIGILVYALYFK